MAKTPKRLKTPKGYAPLEGSERRPARNAKFLGPADAKEQFSVTIILRRRPDGPPLPNMSSFGLTAPSQHRRMLEDEFASKYGAAPDDIDRVTKFANEHGLTVVESNAARRSVVVSGTVAQMSKAFAVTLGRYQHTVVRRLHEGPRTEIYRGRDGFIYAPEGLAEVIIGVFGLDNRRITKRNGGDPPGTTFPPGLQVPQIAQLYNFPTNSAAKQIIAIFSEAGYQTPDIKQYFKSLGLPMPTVTDITVDASNDGNGDTETTQDICIAGSGSSRGRHCSVFHDLRPGRLG